MSALTTGSMAARRNGVTRAYGERQATADGKGTKWVQLGLEHYDVELWIDTRSILNQLEHKAGKTRSGTAKMMGGAVVVKAVNRRKVPDPVVPGPVGPRTPETFGDRLRREGVV